MKVGFAWIKNGEHAMTFEYEFSPVDWLAFSVYHRQHSPAHRRQRFWLRFAFMPVGAIFIVDALLGRQTDPGLALTFVVVTIVWFFLYPKVYDNSATKGIRKTVEDPENARVFGRRTATLTPESLHLRWSGGESTILWDSVLKVAGSQDYIFVYSSTIAAVIIPRLSLQGISFEDLKANIEQYHSGARADRTPHAY
jgi:hypothetical protein